MKIGTVKAVTIRKKKERELNRERGQCATFSQKMKKNCHENGGKYFADILANGLT
jgi:hypothetical protein